jgi:AcrR family transcriptional regulator
MNSIAVPSGGQSLDLTVPNARPSEPAPKSQTRTRLEVEQRRAQLLTLGQELFSSSTYDELSIDDIARAAGISKGLLYHYFPSKRDYYVETIRAAAGELLHQTDTAIELGPVKRLRSGIDAYLTYVERHKKAFAALLRSGVGHDPEVSGIVESTRLAFLDRLLHNTPVHSPRIRNALRGWIGFVESSVLDWIDHNDVAREDLQELLVRALEHIVVDLGAQSPMSAGVSSS